MTTRHILGAVSLLVIAGGVAADDVEPRRWTPLPVGTTVAGIAVIKGKGNIALDPVLQIEDGTIEQTTAVLSSLTGSSHHRRRTPSSGAARLGRSRACADEALRAPRAA
jgi:hypothetical protein